MDFWRFFNEILCEYESPEEFEKMTEMSGNPPENGQKRDFWHFGQGTTCLNGKKSRKIAILAFSGGGVTRHFSHFFKLFGRFILA